MPWPSRVVGGMGLITATTTIMAGITVGTTTDIGMRGVGRTTDNPVGQISARLRASRAFCSRCNGTIGNGTAHKRAGQYRKPSPLQGGVHLRRLQYPEYRVPSYIRREPLAHPHSRDFVQPSLPLRAGLEDRSDTEIIFVSGVPVRR